jgi:hypothetical protein
VSVEAGGTRRPARAPALRQQWRAIARLTLRSQSGLAVASLTLTAAVILGLGWVFGWGSGDAWSWLENISTSLTLVVAFLIWIGERIKDWRDALPNCLTAEFFFAGEKVMVCAGAYLAGEGDIRAWAQQLGFQMTAEQLSLVPDMAQQGSTVEWDPNADNHFCHYLVQVHLRSLPRLIVEMRDSNPGGAPWITWGRPDFGATGAPTSPQGGAGRERQV